MGAYETFQRKLRSRDFQEDAEAGVMCRWKQPARGLILDAIPARTSLAGIDDRWLEEALPAAHNRELPSGTTIRAMPPEWLLVLKLAAFADRGRSDPLSSHDFEDIVVLVDGREEAIGEIERLPPQARSWMRAEMRRVEQLPNFEYGVEGALPGREGASRAAAITLPRLRQLIR